MQHIPVVSHALWRGTFILKMLVMVPTIQTPGSYHQQDWCLFTVGKSLAGLREWREELRCRQSEVSHWFHRRGDISKGLRAASAHQQWQLCLALLTLMLVSALKIVEGSTVVPLYIQWVEPRLFCTPWSIQWCHLCLLPLTAAVPLPWPSLQAAFYHAVVSEAWQMDGKVKTSYLIQTNSSMLSYNYLPKKKKFLQHFRIVKGNTPLRP